MYVSKSIKVVLLLLLLNINLDAKLIGSIGFVSPNYPEFGRYRPSQDVSEFFEEFVETAHSSYSDAGVAVVNRLNMKRGEVMYDDIEYHGTLMIPSEENREMIEKFYAKKSIRFLKKIAKENQVDIILSSNFNKTKLKRMLKTRENPSLLVYRVFAYDVQSGSKKSEYIKIKITDLFSSPDYDPDELQALLIEKYIKIFQELLGHMKIIGSSYSQESKKGSSPSSDEHTKSSEASSETQESDGGDW